MTNLDRFAGSSEEEGPNTDDESVSSNEDSRQIQTHDGDGEEEEEVADDDLSIHDESDSSSDEDEYGAVSARKLTKKKTARNDSDESSDADADSDDDMPLAETSQSGMAGAMAKILGFAPSTKEKVMKSVVLSKTITPLQKQQKKEKEEHDALKLKRKQRREVNLTALHIPLSAATSRPIVGKDKSSDLIAKAMAQEIEVESMHRRVATRGVVALFNTIAQHQQEKAQDQAEAGLTKKSSEIKTMSKHGFLDMLKKTGAPQAGSTKQGSKAEKSAETSGEKKASKGWDALKDDFLMNKKINDWDKDLSDEDESEEEEEETRGVKRSADNADVVDDDWSDAEEEQPKKRKVKA